MKLNVVVTSLPDADELGMQCDDTYAAWFKCAAVSCFEATTPHGYTIFYQTDRKNKGRLFSKAQLIHAAANLCLTSLVWHKIVLRKQPDTVDLYRQGYSHMVCYSACGKTGSLVLPDVVSCGHSLYNNGMNMRAVSLVMQFLAQFDKKKWHVVDPFCGRGSVLVGAVKVGFNYTGIDIDPKQCEHARAELRKAKRALFT